MKLVFRPSGVPDLRVGDAVTLNSGGPLMTVYEIESTGRVLCCWLEGYVMHKHGFAPICLTSVVRT